MTLHQDELLVKHNPILVMFPQDTSRRRPGAREVRGLACGDYHPCSADFFLDRVILRTRPNPFSLRSLFGGGVRPEPTGIEQVKQATLAAGRRHTREWELDVAAIPSQDDRAAWSGYAHMLNDERSPYERVVYARWYQDLTGIVLQYWYLYAYNDFMNNHEGDWEMVSIELSPDGIPERVGISCHEGGYVRDWDNAPKVGDQPMVYVARGSHGGYFSYQEGGHHVPVVTRQLNLPYLGRWLRPLLRRVRWRVAPDRPPADPICDPAAAAEHLGERVEPEIRILPTTPQPGDNRFWWLNIDARWGSRHTRITGTVGCDSPWGQGVRWYDPIGWMDALWW